MKKRSMLTISVLFIIFLYWIFVQLSSPSGDQKVSYDPANKECFSGGSTSPWKYCIYSAKQGTNGGVAYLLHGRNLDEGIWNDDTFYTSLVQKVWATRNDKPPRIVSISFGPIWLLTPKMTKQKSGLLQILTDEVIPTIEKKIGSPKYRAVFGESMGGLNSLTLSLRTKNIFSKAAALCPGIYRGSPFDSLTEIQEFLKRTGADPKVIYGIRTLAKDYVSSQEEWDQISPGRLIEFAVPSETAELYLSTALYDKYGNFEGSEILAERAVARGFKMHWRPLYGGHCAVDITSLADFLLEK